MPDERKTLDEGTIVRPRVADGRAAYEIVDLGDEISTVEKRSDISTHTWAAVTGEGSVLTASLREQIERENKLADLFGWRALA